MHLCLNAWLERKEPQRHIYDSESGTALLALAGEDVRQLIDSGLITPTELMSPMTDENELVQNLLQYCGLQAA